PGPVRRRRRLRLHDPAQARRPGRRGAEARAEKPWATRVANVLRIHRGERGYQVKLNGVDIGLLPAQLASGEVNAAGVSLAIKGKDNKSPRVYAVRVVPVP